MANDHPKPGDEIAGKYRVEKIIGAGGMGVVVAAHHLTLLQPFAIKFLLADAMKLPGASARFVREARAAASIRSEHVTRVVDVSTLASGEPYMVMEYLDGADLSDVLRERGPLAIDEAIDFVLQACDGLAEAHALGIVHRDLKPANIFLARRPGGSQIIKLLDFGISKMALIGESAFDTSVTDTNVTAGSPHYMSPEQIRSLKTVDARTDVWALGVILYELLTDKKPFHGPSVASVYAAVAADIPRAPRSLRQEIPEGLDRLILRCLIKDMSKRVQTVAELAEGLAPFAAPRSAASIERIRKLSSGPAPARTPTAVTVRPAPEEVPTRAYPKGAPPPAAERDETTEPDGDPTVRDSRGGHEDGGDDDASPDPRTDPSSGWGQTRPPARRRSGVKIVGAIGAAILGMAATWWGVSRSTAEGSGTVAPGPTAAAVTASASVSPTASASATAERVASAALTASATTSTTTRPKPAPPASKPTKSGEPAATSLPTVKSPNERPDIYASSSSPAPKPDPPANAAATATASQKAPPDPEPNVLDVP